MGGRASKRKAQIPQEERYADRVHRSHKVFQPSSSNISSSKDSDTDFELREEDTVISDNEKKELVSLFTDKNISMDFVLEMKEAFLYFDKVIFLLGSNKF